MAGLRAPRALQHDQQRPGAGRVRAADGLLEEPHRASSARSTRRSTRSCPTWARPGRDRPRSARSPASPRSPSGPVTPRPAPGSCGSPRRTAGRLHLRRPRRACPSRSRSPRRPRPAGTWPPRASAHADRQPGPGRGGRHAGRRPRGAGGRAERGRAEGRPDHADLREQQHVEPGHPRHLRRAAGRRRLPPPPQGGTAGHVESAQSQVGTNAQRQHAADEQRRRHDPDRGGHAGTGGGLVPTGGTATAPSTVPVGTGTRCRRRSRRATTPSGLAPTLPGQPPLGPPVQPGPSVPSLPVGTSNPALNNPVIPGFGNTSTIPPGGGADGEPNTNPGNRGPIVGRGPLPTGANPTGNPAVPVNAGDVARRPLPLRGGLPAGGAGSLEPNACGRARRTAAAVSERCGAGTERGPQRPGCGVGGRWPGRGGRSWARVGGRGVSGPGTRGGMNGQVGAGGRRAERRGRRRALRAGLPAGDRGRLRRRPPGVRRRDRCGVTQDVTA